ncbi:MAG TPA: hypothetical protein DCO75_08560 [Fibrobacteres bacterium]|nr:hypothetical protein [Fibrobacterota bacterium]
MFIFSIPVWYRIIKNTFAPYLQTTFKYFSRCTQESGKKTSENVQVVLQRALTPLIFFDKSKAPFFFA